MPNSRLQRVIDALLAIFRKRKIGEPQTTSSKSMAWSRRSWIGVGVVGLVGVAGKLASRVSGRPKPNHLRPPGAVDNDSFADKCARCFKCASVCPNDCISYYGLDAGVKLAFTPYIKARERGCTLCGECADACPTGALEPFEVSRKGWVEGVEMGTARVNEGLCYSFAGRTCGACYRACPLAGEALTIGVFETPHINPDFCVGCGLCEQSCLHLPQAIRVVPKQQIGELG